MTSPLHTARIIELASKQEVFDATVVKKVLTYYSQRR